MIEKDSAFLSNLRVKNKNRLVIRNRIQAYVMATVIESVIQEQLDCIFCYGFNVCLKKNSFNTVCRIIMILYAFVLLYDL